MKARAIGYWACTILIGFSYVASGAAHLLRLPQVVEAMTQLGYPAHFVFTMGIWKVLAGVAVLLPGFARLKEWAYAVMAFDLTAAAVAHAAAGNGGLIVLQVVLAELVIASWALRPESRKLNRTDTSRLLRSGGYQANTPSTVGETSLPDHLRAMREASGVIASNAERVLREAGTLGVPKELRGRIRTVWRDLHNGCQGAMARIARVEAGTRDPVAEIECIETRLGQAILAILTLGAVPTLVDESAANALRAYGDLKHHSEKVRTLLLLDEASVPEAIDFANTPSVAGEPSLLDHLRAMREASAEIASNAEYVLREVGTLSVPNELRRRIETVWRDLNVASQRIESMATRGEAKKVRYPLDEIEWIESGLEPKILALDGLVKDLGRASDDKALAVAAILVNESGANVLRAYADLKRHGERFRDRLPVPDRAPRTLREEAGVPEGIDLVQHLRCASCGNPAATLEVGIDPLSGDRALVYSGLVRREALGLTKAGQVFAKLAQGKTYEVHTLVGGEGLDAYCPACDRFSGRSRWWTVSAARTQISRLFSMRSTSAEQNSVDSRART